MHIGAPRRNLIAAATVLFAIVVTTSTPLVATGTHSPSTSALPTAAPSPTSHVAPLMCDLPCGAKFGLVTLDIQVTGVPAFYNGVYPVYVPFNLAFISNGVMGSEFQDVPVQGGLVIQEANGGSGFIGSYNTQECDLANPDQGCFVDQNTIDYGSNPLFFNYAGFPYDSPYYSKVPGQFSFIVNCNGFPFGEVFVGGDGNVTISITLDYQDCQGYDYGNSGVSGSGFLNVSNNTTGPWDFVPAMYENISEMNLSLRQNDSVTFSGGTACPTCFVSSGTTFALAPNETTAGPAGGVRLSIPLLGLPSGNYSWNLSLPGFASDPSGGSLSILGNRTVAISGDVDRTYPVTFTEAGLPTGLRWTPMQADDTIPKRHHPSLQSILLELPNGTYNLTPEAAGYSLNSTTSQFQVNGTALNLSLHFSGPVVYPVVIDDMGAPPRIPPTVVQPQGTSSGGFRVPTAGSQSTVIYLANGTYRVAASGGTWYTVSPSPVNLTVAGSGPTLTFTFSPTPTHLVTIGERGLPSGSLWGISVGRPAHNATSTTTSVQLPLTAALLSSGVCTGNMTMIRPAGYAPDHLTPGCGASSTAVSVRFGHVAPLTFVASGLPPNTYWYVTLHSPKGDPTPIPAQGTIGKRIHFNVPQGKYTFQVTVDSTYRAIPAHRSVGVSAAGLNKTIRFVPFTGRLLFSESGLPQGSLWGVNLTGPLNESLVTTGSTLEFTVINGTYRWTSWTLSGTALSPSSGSLSLHWTLTVRVQRVSMT